MTRKLPQIVEPFHQTLDRHNLSLNRAKLTTLQVNVGLLCNMACRHCHLKAGPGRQEVMGSETVGCVIDFVKKYSFEVIDITGGAPEMNPHIIELIEGVRPHASRLILRSNLTALSDEKMGRLIEVCVANQITVVASFPALNKAQSEAQRGNGVFDSSIDMLKELNQYGYGSKGSNHELHLVSNPTGAFMPPEQKQLEDRFRQQLKKKWGIIFNDLYVFANVPLGRYRDWLEKSDNYVQYMNKLVKSFNPCALSSVMCRSLLSVNWDGYLYDCDFNLALDLPMGGQKKHLNEIDFLPGEGEKIAVSDHCYSCTAGAGFT